MSLRERRKWKHIRKSGNIYLLPPAFLPSFVGDFGSLGSRRRLVGASTCGRNGTFAVICVLQYRVSIPQGGRRYCESELGALSVWYLRAGVVASGQTKNIYRTRSWVQLRWHQTKSTTALQQQRRFPLERAGQTTPRLRVFFSWLLRVPNSWLPAHNPSSRSREQGKKALGYTDHGQCAMDCDVPTYISSDMRTHHLARMV